MNYTTSYQSNRPAPKPKRRSKRPLLIGLLLIVLAGAGWWLFGRNVPATQQATQNTPLQTAPTAPEPAPLPNLSGLQTVVDDWVGSHSGTYAVTILNQKGDTIASVNEDTSFFTASLYKLWVAYEGYRQVANGTYSMDDPYLTGYNREECLDAMIRSSYSPCAEKMWAELGKEAINTKIKDYGMTGTSMVGLSTTSHDAALILQRLYTRKELSEDHTKAYLDSMKTQDIKFRRGLPAGFKAATVYNKVGWNEAIEWHDASIVEFKNGQVLMIAVLTKNAGYKNVAGLGAAIEKFVIAQ